MTILYLLLCISMKGVKYKGVRKSSDQKTLGFHHRILKCFKFLNYKMCPNSSQIVKSFQKPNYDHFKQHSIVSF